MKLKLLIFTFFILHFTFLFSDTIIVSVYSDPLLDGYIRLSQNAQALSVNNWMYDMHIGDSGWDIFVNDPNSYNRSYFSFDLPEIPENYYIDSVYVRLYQFLSWGYDSSTGQYTDFPVWNVVGGDTIKCIMSHINYGNELDIGDWEKGDVGNPYTYQNNIGTITESGIDGYRYLDVTVGVIQDYELNRDKTQYRIAFQINTDWDSETDLVAFKTANSAGEHHRPQIFLILTYGINTSDEELSITNYELRNFPNPFNPETTISFTTKHTKSTEKSIEIIIYNIKGQKIKTFPILNSSLLIPNQVVWDGRDNNGKEVTSGLYLCRLRVGKLMFTRKMLLLR